MYLPCHINTHIQTSANVSTVQHQHTLHSTRSHFSQCIYRATSTHATFHTFTLQPMYLPCHINTRYIPHVHTSAKVSTLPHQHTQQSTHSNFSQCIYRATSTHTCKLQPMSLQCHINTRYNPHVHTSAKVSTVPHQNTLQSTRSNFIQCLRFEVYYGDDYEEWRLLECYAVWLL
jgi:hypothetical protein